MEKDGIGLQTFGNDAIRARGGGSISESKDKDFDQDRYELARVGKQQVLKVRGPPTSTLTFSDHGSGALDW
jgi:choline transport protein